jgi:hypothetical protein
MATSGSQNFTQTRIQLIQDAFQLIGIYGVGRTISAEDEVLANNFLNKMIKAWGTKGLHLWTKEEAVLFISQYEEEYTLGNASGDAHCALESDTVITQLNGALAASATSVTVDSTTGMAVSDNIGIVTSDNDIHWTTIATIPSSTTLTLTTGLDTAANDNDEVYTYTNKIYKPLRITSCRRREGIDSGATSTQFEQVLTPISYEEFRNLPTKTTNSLPNQFHYNPKNTSGKLYLYPRPDDGKDRIHISYERVIEDLDAASDNFDFPSEWLECITYQLALRLGACFGKGQKALQEIAPLASVMLDDLLSWDAEHTELRIIPDMDY